ncbi:DUF637 domain-containing protein, partial [Vibrio cholerae]|uniref:DUF637 domain-containing protein n=1 Tax=Vibrio cholerae TaxID=666 RepID=UPI001929EAB1
IGASALNNVSDKQWINNLTVNLANAGSAALINTAVNGGSLKDNLEANILAALVNTAHGEAASKNQTVGSALHSPQDCPCHSGLCGSGGE